MCHITDYHHHDHENILSSYKNNNSYLRLNSLTLNLSLSNSLTTSPYFPEFLSLVFLPRINNNTHLEIDGSKIRPDSPAFLTLHRTLHVSSPTHIAFASKDRVIASDGTGFEVHVGDLRLLKGVFRRSDDGGEWRVECKHVAKSGIEFTGVKEVELFATCESERSYTASIFVIRERVVRCGKNKKGGFKMGLEEIPEERECDVEDEETGLGGGECSWYGGDDGSDGEDEEMMVMSRMEREIEGVGWAVDVGIWVVCLGVGLLVSRASARRFLRRKCFV